MQKTIFVAGIHGVGKTYLCESVSHLGLNFTSASLIIKNELVDSNWDKNKVVSDAEKNQIALISGVEKIRRLNSSKSLLLDGHFVLRTSNGFLNIEHDIFDALELDAIILVEDDAGKIASRLEIRDSVRPPEDLNDFLQLERVQAKKFSVDKYKPFYIVKSGDVDEFSKVVKNIINTEML